MKTVYLVRHGESEGNVDHFGQSQTTPLTDRGRAQAQEIARRTQNIKFDLLVASPFVRAQETAQAIATATNHAITTCELFGERRRASHVIGLSHQDPKSIAEVERWWRTWGEHDKSSDAESYPQLKERAAAAWHWLSERPEEIAIVITHDFMARLLLAYSVFEEELTPTACRLFIQRFHLGNTGLAGFSYNQTNHPNHWDVLFWNDQSHLADDTID